MTAKDRALIDAIKRATIVRFKQEMKTVLSETITIARTDTQTNELLAFYFGKDNLTSEQLDRLMENVNNRGLIRPPEE